jgi:hypothetical protein
MRTHLALDLAGGAILALSPWLFGFSDYIWAPHLILGILEIGATLMTKLHPANESREHRRTSTAAEHGIL